MILIIGNKGNMGRRYKACLDYLEIENEGFDKDVQHYDAKYLVDNSNSVIIATPTDTHTEILSKLYEGGYRKPVLCEKPISKNISEVRYIETISRVMPITMVFQYAFIDFIGYKTAILDKGVKYQSYYNYFKHGNDGIKWNCIQLINMAENEPLLLDTSPTWDCIINGYRADQESMDRAYMKMIEHWIANPGWNFDGLVKMHEKVVNLA